MNEATLIDCDYHEKKITCRFMRRGNPVIGERFSCWNEEYVVVAITGEMDQDGYVPLEAERI